METFSSSPLPSDFQHRWDHLLKLSTHAGTREQRLWTSHQAVWKRTSRQQYANYADYQQDLDQLVEELAGSKKTLSEEANKFFALSAITQQDLATRYARYPVFVHDEVLEAIDNIYIKHYHEDDSSEDGVNQLLCFTCHRCGHSVVGEDQIPVCRTALHNYLQDVEEYLKRRPALDGVGVHHPQQTGVANAAIRLVPLHMPIGIPGIFTLPLASPSMLQDLWKYMISIDQSISFEVRPFPFFTCGYSIHPAHRSLDGSMD